MRKYLEKLPQDILSLIYKAREAAETIGCDAYLVGGFVRDLILGMKNFDLDIVIEGDGIKFAEVLSSKLQARLIRHRRFGTATLIMDHYLKIDIASTRKESYPHPAALPVVEKGNLRDDLFRRDFTINAMAIVITGEDFGKLTDYYEGECDLRNRKIRILHSLSFIDDPTRILRCIRFEQRFGFRIERRTLRCLKESVKSGMLKKIQPQRIRDELVLMLREDFPSRELKRINELVGFSFIEPTLYLPAANHALFKSIRPQAAWFRKELPVRRHLDIWLIYFMLLLDPLSARRVSSVLKRFVFHKGVEKRVLTYKKTGPKIIAALNKDKIKPSRLFGLLEPLSYEVIILLMVTCRRLNVMMHISDFLKNYNGRRHHISGRDLLDLGLIPGPYYQRIFKDVIRAQLDGKVRTKEEEIELVKKMILKKALFKKI